MTQKLRISLKRGSAMTVNRVAIGDSQLVYAICADKKIKYPHGSSPVVYFGTTERGVDRIAASAAYRAAEVLNIYGVKSFDVRIITCKSEPGVKSWKLLERALLIGFRERFGATPKCNDKGRNMTPTREFDLFARDRIMRIISDLTDHGQAETHEIIEKA